MAEPGSANTVRAIARRELGAFFGQPAAWVFLAAFLVVAGVVGLHHFFERNVAELRDYFLGLRYAFVLLAPAAAMRLWAEERRSGTFELLFTLPVRPWEAVLGKYLAGLVVVAAALLLGAALPLSLSPFADFDAGQIASGYLGTFAVAATFLAVGLLASALTRSQEIAFIVAALACALLNLFGDPVLVARASDLLGDSGRAVVSTVSELAVGPHHRAFSRGVLELRGVAYFFGVTAAVLFWTVLAVERRGRPREQALAVGLSLAVLVLWVGVSGDRRLNGRVDLTTRRRNSVAPDTRALLAKVKDSLTIRAYLSSSRIPESAQSAVRDLLDLLEAVESAGGGRVILEVVDPVAAWQQEEAERFGVRRTDMHIQREGSSRVDRIYAGVVVFCEGRTSPAIPFALGRANPEYDLALAIRRVVLHRQRIGIAGSRTDAYQEAARALRQSHSVSTFDLRRVKQIPDDVSLMIYAAPAPPPERELYVLDQFLARGGKLILLAESHREGQGFTAEPLDRGPFQETLAAWGVTLGPGLLLQVAYRQWTLPLRGRQVLTPYPWFMGPTGQQNPESAVASHLGQLVFPIAAEVSLTKPLPPGCTGTVLLESPPAWSLEGPQGLSPDRRIELNADARRALPMAVAVRGPIRSAWTNKASPVLLPEASGGADPLALPLAKSAPGGCVVLIGDTDFLHPRWLREGEGAALLQNIVDWCLGLESLAAIRGRLAQIPLEGKDTVVLGLQRDVFVQFLNLFLLPLVVFGLGLGRLAWARHRRGRAATRLRQSLAEATS